MSSLLLLKTDIGLKHFFFAHNVSYGNSVTFRIWVALESLQYLDNHEPQRFDFCIEGTSTDRTCQLYHHKVKIMFIYEGTNSLVSGAFLKCFSIFKNKALTVYEHYWLFRFRSLLKTLHMYCTRYLIKLYSKPKASFIALHTVPKV